MVWACIEKRRRICGNVGKRVMVMEVPGKRRRGSLKRRWLDSTSNNLLGGEYTKTIKSI